MSETCPFCAIVRRQAPATITYEDAEIVSFRDTAPMAPFHELVIPRQHIRSLAEATEQHIALFGRLMLVARLRAREAGYAVAGYRVVTNVGRDGHQTVGRVHLHVLAGRPLTWPPG